MRQRPARRCEQCGAMLSRYNPDNRCSLCQAAARDQHTTVMPATRPPPGGGALWVWAAPSAQAVLSTREPGLILTAYRAMHQLSQAQLAELLGFDQSYISRLERGERRVRDIRLLAHIANRLAIPPHLVGLSSDDADDFAAMVQFAESTLRLADVARQSGRAVDAARELGPLVARLESRLAEGRADRDALILLGQGRLALGTALGHILPEERLAVAARWTGRAWSLASRLDDTALQGHVLRMHGNELRKAGHVPAAIARLSQAAAMTDQVALRGATLALLARAAAEHGDTGMFDTAIGEASRLLEGTDQFTMLLNPFSIREIRIRGLLATGRINRAVAEADQPDHSSAAPLVAPQWRVIDKITSGAAMLAAGDTDATVEHARAGISLAETYRLPHQVQRALRLLRATPGDAARALLDVGMATLTRLRHGLSSPPTA
jgi:transcriptional regulator with XRE-family HTH domain